MVKLTSNRERLLYWNRWGEDQVEASLTELIENPPEVDSYIDEKENELSHFKNIVTLDEVLDKLAKAQIGYVGDYHATPSSSQTILKIIRGLKERGGELLVAIEMVQIQHQEVLDRYMSGMIGKQSFITKAFRSWDFPFYRYKPFFDACRYHSIPLIAIGHHRKSEDPMRLRDQVAADVIASKIDFFKTLLVFAGDAHLASSHLPAKVNQRVQSKISTVTIFQGQETIYNQLVKQGIEQEANIVRLKGNQYCVVKETPFHQKADFLLADEKEEYDLIELVGPYSEIITGFLGLDFAEELSGLSICSQKEKQDLEKRIEEKKEELEEKATQGEISFRELEMHLKELAEKTAQMKGHYSCHIPQTGDMYFFNPNSKKIAELIGVYIHDTYINKVEGRQKGRTLIDRFYYKVLQNTMKYIAFKIINHKHSCKTFADYEKTVREGYNPGISPGGKEIRRAELIIDYRNIEQETIKSNRISNLFYFLYGLDTKEVLTLTRTLGQTSGEKIFEGLMKEIITIEDVRGLYQNSFAEEGSARRKHINLMKELVDVGNIPNYMKL